MFKNLDGISQELFNKEKSGLKILSNSNYKFLRYSMYLMSTAVSIHLSSFKTHNFILGVIFFSSFSDLLLSLSSFFLSKTVVA